MAGTKQRLSAKTREGDVSAAKTEAYQEGYRHGYTQDGEAEDNPYKHRNSKRRKEWFAGWMDGSEQFIHDRDAERKTTP